MQLQPLRVSSALALIVIVSPATAQEPQAPTSARSMTTQFTYTANVPDISPNGKKLELWLPIPANSPWQTVRDLTVDSPVPYRLTQERKFGNRMLYLRAASPQSPFKVTVRFVVTRKAVQVLAASPQTPAASPAPSAATDTGRLLEPDKNVPIGGRYGDIAHQVTGPNASPREEVRALFDHVVATMQYDYKKESPKYAQGDVAFVCDYKKGNCSDLHSYLISLARSLGVPAILEFGFPITGVPLGDPIPKEGTISGYHCWTWFQDGNRGWLPLDAADARRWEDARRPEVKEYLFGNLVLERSAVAMSRGRDLTLEPPQKAGPLNYFIYPYAEVDGTPVEAKWDLRYSRLDEKTEKTALVQPPSSDVQQQLDELRSLVAEQRKEINELRSQVGLPPAPTAPKNAKPPVQVTAPSRERVNVYGFLRLDGIWDSGATDNSQTPLFVQSPSNANIRRTGNSVLTLSPRLTRLGFNFAAPEDTLRGTNVTGKLEFDWQNGSGLTVESRPLPRVRLAYLQLQRGPNSYLFGQTWDIISPLNPSPNDSTVMWNAGNLGDRRPQIRFTYEPAKKPFNFTAGLGLTGAVDGQDLDANGIRDGEDSGLPNVQARLGWKGKKGAVGVWGHYAWETLTKKIANHARAGSYSVGLDLSWLPLQHWDMKGELWTGQNLSDFRGGIGQGINPTTGLPIRSSGGWLEAGYQPTSAWRVAVGYTLDSPLGQDIPAGGRTRNDAIYLHNKWRMGGNTSVGLNYLFWTTRWKGLATGVDNRINGFIQHDF